MGTVYPDIVSGVQMLGQVFSYLSRYLEITQLGY